LLALAALAVHVALGLLAYRAGPLGVDRAAFDLLAPVRDRALLGVARVATDVGSFPAAVLVTALGALVALRRGVPGRAVALVAGLVVLLVAVEVAKDLWDRPRPRERFYEPGGLSFPSGHGAYAMAWLAAAVPTGRRGLILGAAAVVVAVGASRLYLHVHYLTDVLGGFALGAAVFAPVLTRR